MPTGSKERHEKSVRIVSALTKIQPSESQNCYHLDQIPLSSAVIGVVLYVICWTVGLLTELLTVHEKC
jgi:hypothetical protein